MTPFAWFRWARRLVTLVVLAGLAFVVLTVTRVWWVGREDAQPPSDAIVVLGASQFDGRPSAIFAARLDHAAALYRAHVAAHVVTVGGGRPGDRFTEAQAGANYLERQGVPASALVVVGIGSDTLLSLQAAAPQLVTRRWHRLVLVTDRWHVLRSRTMARDLGFTAVGSPVSMGPSVHGLSTEARYIARETVAYIYYEVFHRASRAGPPAV